MRCPEQAPPSSRVALGRAPICLKCFQPGHMRKECPMSKAFLSSASSYANVLNRSSVNIPSTCFVPVSALPKENAPLPPPPPPAHVKLYERRVDEDWFYTPKQNAKKSTSSECNTVPVSNISTSVNSSTKKMALQTSSPSKIKHNHTSDKLQSAAAGANTSSLRSENLSSLPKSKPGKPNLNKEPAIESMDTVMDDINPVEMVSDVMDNLADTEKLNDILSSMTPGRSTDGEGFGLGEESSEDSPI
ncbi:hypothetical protein LOTGIDRAFT_175252 [Lottia gigantea]|uniref:CCHC-type domain-containing protein n=1 Tax=Lottia gigantea TaxID=225164 RepID=V4AE69_LOTGI|nr:hypothetical protein LOTGIDRAFT_175252 [Lottia gigantea]ESO95177.1 hypothetical protein LOTGIDRAFT_175252 [Lottia gigantea]